MSAMITSPNRLASEAGAEVLRSGGNAIEAAVATAAVLTVVYPHFCGLGGDAVWMVADRTGTARVLLGIGQAGETAYPGMTLTTRGPGSLVTSAGLVDSWGTALAYSAEHWNGGEKLDALLAPAIGYAKNGFPLSSSQRHWLDHRRDETPQWPGFADIFLDAGQAPETGSTFRQPALANTLSAIPSEGTRGFYEGALAARIADGLRAAGSPLTAADLAATRTAICDPVAQAYRDFEILAPPPPTQGLATLMALGILNRFDLSQLAENSTDHIHLVVEAIKQAFLHREKIADFGGETASLDDLLSPERLNAAADAIDPGKALEWPQPFQEADTVYIGAVDGEGRCVSMLQSTYFDWGSGVVIGDTGILWHNRGAAFSSDSRDANCIAPGKRPFHTLNPGIAMKNGRPHLLYGTQGADGQPQTLALLLTRLVDYRLSPQAALAGPRFLLGKTFSDQTDTLKIEADIADDVIAELKARGHQTGTIAAQSPLAGQAGVIRLDDGGGCVGAHDPRSDGAAISVDR